MNRTRVAFELVKLARSLVSHDKMAGTFDTEKRHFDMVTQEQLSGILKAARKNRGKVTTKKGGRGNYFLVKVVFRDNFPESFASRDVASFDEDVKSLGLEKFRGMPEMVF